MSGAREWQERDDLGAIREMREETGFHIAASLQQIGVRYEYLARSRVAVPEGTVDIRLGSIPSEKGLSS